RQLVCGDDLQDRALGDAVTAAYLGGVRQYFDAATFALAIRQRAEHQGVAQIGDVAAGADQIEIPGAVAGVAIKYGADQPVAANDEMLVDAAGGIAEDDLFRAVVAGEIAGGEHVDAGDLEPRAGDGRHVVVLRHAG